jgi:hypothetical protein
MKKSIQIIRIEGKDGYGIFRGETAIDDVVGFEKLIDRHFNSSNEKTYIPTPSYDELYLNRGDKTWYCAFKSLEQFNGFIKKHEAKRLIRTKENINSLFL